MSNVVEGNDVAVDVDYEINDSSGGEDTSSDTTPTEPIHVDVQRAYTVIARFVKYGHTDITSDDIKNILYSEHITDEVRYYLIPIALYIIKEELTKLKSNTGS